MKALAVLFVLMSSTAHAQLLIDADLKLTKDQVVYAQAGLKDLTQEASRQRFTKFFVNAEKELPKKCEFKTTVTRYQEMPLAHQGRMLALLWKTEPLCKSYGTVQSTRVVWVMPDGVV